MSFGMSMLGGMLNTAFKTDYPATSPFALWRDDYDRRAREGEAKYYAQNQVPWLVQGAKAAGIHPLALLPGGTSQMRGSNTPLAAPGGGNYYRPGRPETSKQLTSLQIERANLENDYLREQIIDSQHARAMQGQSYTTQDGVTVHPVGRKAGAPLTVRTHTPRAQAVEPNRNIPEFIVQEGPSGRRKIRNPAVGDELAEIDTAVRPWLEYLGELYNEAFNRKWSQPGPQADAKAKYYYWRRRLLGNPSKGKRRAKSGRRNW